MIDDEATRTDVSDGGGSEAEPTPRPEDGSSEAPSAEAEVDILRSELDAMQTRVDDALEAKRQAEERALRFRAELDTVRRRVAGEEARAREAGFDAAVLPVMSVHDDLVRALQAAAVSDDPASIVPGVHAVLEGLGRELDKLGLRRVGAVGDAFDPDLHEALTSVPVTDGAAAGTIASVFEAGFVHGERLVRPARVVVYQDAD